MRIGAIHHLFPRRTQSFAQTGQRPAVAIDLDRLLICAGCEVAFEISRASDCPRCGKGLAVWPLWRWLNREGMVVSSGDTTVASA